MAASPGLGLQAGSIHWWRINTNTSAGWQTSATGMFVPCGNPQPLTADATCADANNATVDFRWAPLAGPNGNQFIDIGQDGNFPAGSFQGAGPIQSGVSSYKWSNIKTNVLYYYRINQQQSDGTWKASPVKSFTLAAAPTAAHRGCRGQLSTPTCTALTTSSASPAVSDRLPLRQRRAGQRP